MQTILLIGNLGQDPQMRYTPGGQNVTSFSVASNRRYKTQGGETREETDWFNVSAWNKLGEICNEHLNKASMVYVEGELRLRTYEKRDGQPAYSLEVVADKVQFLSSRRNGSLPASEEDDLPPIEEDDLPF